MQRFEVSGAVRPIYGSLGVKRLISLFQCFGGTYVSNFRVNSSKILFFEGHRGGRTDYAFLIPAILVWRWGREC